MNKDQLTIIGLATALGASVGFNIRSRQKYSDLLETARTLYSVAMTNDKQNDYLRDILDRNEVPITEFDILAMNALTQD